MPRAFLAQIAESVGIDADGRIRSSANESARVQTRKGEWHAFDSSPNVTLLVRANTVEATAPDRRAVLSGDLSAIPTADLVTFLNQGRLTGVLLVRSDGIDRTLTFKDGKLCWGSSTDSSERIGEVAVRHGLIPRSALEKLAASPELEEPGKKFGQKLVQLGLINGHQQWRALQLHVSEIFFSFLLKKAGTFVFALSPGDPSFESHLTIDPQSLLLEGVRRVDELRHFRRKIPSSLVKPRLTGVGAPRLGETDRSVAQLIDGTRTIIELGMLSSLGEFGATKAVHHLIELGVAVLDPIPSRERTPGPPSNDPESLVGAFNEALQGIYDAASSSGMDAPYRISLDAFLLGEKGSAPLLTGLSLEPDGTLPEETLLARARDDAGVQLREQLEQVLSFALFQAREILDIAAADQLARRARTLTAG